MSWRRYRTLKWEEAVRYLMARGFPSRADAIAALDEMEGRDYGAIQNEAGAVISYTRTSGIRARYRSTREVIEADAVDRERCTVCLAEPGKPCRSVAGKYSYGKPLKHPHKERVDTARMQRRV